MKRMSHVYAARRLLEHGPLPMGEFLAITGWKRRSAEWALTSLIKRGIVRRENRRYTLGYVYHLSAGATWKEYGSPFAAMP